MSKVIKHFKKYNRYIMYSAKSELKNEVANSYLNWLWWILDPIFFMLIYTFIVQVVFRTSELYFPVFVLIGLTLWNFFNKVVSISVKIVSANRGIVSKIYIPKYMLVLQKMYINFFKMIISLILIFILMVIFQVPFAMTILYILPLTIILFIVTFGVAVLLAHLGVFAEDLANIVNIVLRLLFYLSGIFYSVATRIPAPYNNLMLKSNPLAYLIEEYRNVMIYNSLPNFSLMLYWFLIGILLLVFAIRLIYKHENSYVKVI